MTTSIEGRIAEELGVRERQVKAAVELLDGGSTVPFIARYRKEATEMLDDAQLRTLEERLRYLRELEDRRAAVLESVREQGKLDRELEARIRAADTKARLEDIYLPFKPKRRTKAQIAREAGLEPLASGLLDDPSVDPLVAATAFVDADKGVADPAAALEGARAILAERFSEDADLTGELRERMWTRGRLVAKVRDGKEEAGAKFADYFDFTEPFTALPSHRVLAMLRGEKEDVLDLVLEPEEPSGESGPSSYENMVARRFGVNDRGRPGDKWLADTVRWAWRTRLWSTSASTCGCGCARRRRTRRYVSSRRTCAICCSPRRPGRVPRWGSTRVSVPGSRSPSSTRPARSSRPMSSTHTSLPTSGTSRWRNWSSWRRRTMSI